ncbi:MAG: hypothetical protein SFV17_25035 [Candidatus Obscuribacter sp.]|nr:hypothetical protein [Candidatus Melainabacteria bacterium]MDX1989982.1 hypothetical protein [Candidatus Obscuribacter sp.]
MLKRKTKKRAGKSRGLMGLLDKLMLLSVIIPPGYIIFRFCRWYVESVQQEDEEFID